MPSFREQSKEFRENAGKSAKAAEALLDKITAEGREMTSDEEIQVDKLQEEAERLVKKACRLERQAELDLGFEVESNLNRDQSVDDEGVDENVRPLGRISALAQYATPDYRDSFESYLAQGGSGISRAMRGALQIDLETGGGYVVISDRFIDKVIQVAKDLLPLLNMVELIPAIRGENLGAVSVDSTVGAFSMAAGELTGSEDDDNIKFGRRELSPHDVRRKTIKVSNAMLRMPGRIDIEQFVAAEVAYLYTSLKEDKIINGSGAGEPLGLMVASSQGISTSRDVSTDNTATAVTPDNAIEVQDTLKPAYGLAAQWLFHRNYLTRLRKKKDGNGQYLWQPGLQLGQPSLFLGKPYQTSEFFPNTFTANQYVGIYGAFKNYWFAHVVNFIMQRLIEKYAEAGQTGLLFDQMAIDGQPVKEEAFVRVQMGS